MEYQIPPQEASRMRIVRGLEQEEQRQRDRILALLDDAGGSANVYDLAVEVGTSTITVRQRIRELREAGHEVVMQDDAVMEIGARLSATSTRR